MQINSVNPNISYTSRNCPIKPFKIKTSQGILECRELDYNKSYTNTFLGGIGQFFLDIFANTSSHPFWKKCRKPTMDKAVYDSYIADNIKDYRQALKDPDTTFLIARNKWGSIKAAIYSRSLDIDGKIKEPLTLYIDSIAVNKNLRGANIGKKLMDSVIEASKNNFEDVFLVAYKEAVPFYEKMGFKQTQGDVNKNRALKELVKERIDYPDYAEFLEQKLSDVSGTKWFERADNCILK